MPHHRQRGVVLPLLAVGMLTLIGIVGLSIDVGHAFLDRSRLQNSLDSAALSGARTLLLSGDVEAAGADARHAFAQHLEGDMADLDAGSLVLQYSDTLVPFVAGGDEPRYVRAVFEAFTAEVFFAALLPGVDGPTNIAATAVAGPAPLGYPGAVETCDIGPLLMCGVAGDRDCSDGDCFGYRVGSRTEYELKLGGVTSGEDGPGARGPRASACGEGSAYYGCVPAPERIGGPGSFLLHDPACAGDGCIRESVAGAFDACLTGGAPVTALAGATPGPVLQGLMTRFGVYHSSLGPAEYPPDVVSTGRDEDVDYWYDAYRRDVASIVSAGSYGSAVPHRRVIAVPVVSCPSGAVGPLVGTPLGTLCLFLTRAVGDGESGDRVYGQFVDACEASGERGASVPALPSGYGGPVEIVLYADPESYGS